MHVVSAIEAPQLVGINELPSVLYCREHCQVATSAMLPHEWRNQFTENLVSVTCARYQCSAYNRSEFWPV